MVDKIGGRILASEVTKVVAKTDSGAPLEPVQLS